MKLTGLFFMVLAVLAMFIGAGQADPKGGLSAVKRGGKAIGRGASVANAGMAAHDLYKQARGRQ